MPERRLTSWGKALPSINPNHEKHPAAQPWFKVMCLTGVDYFSTLGYQPGIAFLAAGVLSPLATAILVLITLFGALPTYNLVAQASPHGEGSISMLESFLSRWKGKLFVLCLLGFAATDFIITITLSAADATAHLAENPICRTYVEHHKVLTTLFLISVLGVVFWRGFHEAVSIAVVLVICYLGLNGITLGVGLYHLAQRPELFGEWMGKITLQYPEYWRVIAACALVFPKLALGLSGFETGVAVMPLVKGDPGDDAVKPAGRIRNTRTLLTAVAVIMSVYLMASSFVTTLLIDEKLFQTGGAANGRALAYLSHKYLGETYGTVYDGVTVLILWFAGASAMAGLLNLVPRYLPRYGMAPEWAREQKPMVLLFTSLALIVTIGFNADVDAQGGAYATGVLFLMSSAAVAVTLMTFQQGQRVKGYFFSSIAAVFAYTTAVNIYERPDGVKIASFFILGIVAISLWSRLYRSTELRVESVEFDELAEDFILQLKGQPIRVLANRPHRGDIPEYQLKEEEQREFNHIPPDDEVIFLEINIGDASDFGQKLTVSGVEVGPYKILRTESPAVSNAIAAILLHIRDASEAVPHAYFGWKEGNPGLFLLGYLAFGEGDIAPVTREVLRRAEADSFQRPRVHVA
jgi:hypothetical protein